MSPSERFAHACVILGIDQGATREEIRSAYRDLVKVWHPDRFRDDIRLRAKAERQLAAIDDAYDYLINIFDRPADNRPPPSPPSPSHQPTPSTHRSQHNNPRATSSRSMWLGWSLAVLLVAVGVIVINTQSSRLPQASAPPSVTFSSQGDSDPAPVQLEPAPVRCHPANRPRSSAELGARHRGGLGRLRVTNGTDLDAVAVLTEGGTSRRAIYIRNGEDGLMTAVPRGRYHLQFQLGSTWQADRRFCEVHGTSEFSSTLEFDEVEMESGIEYNTYEVTLHPVLHGTARTHSIPASEFQLPPLQDVPNDP